MSDNFGDSRLGERGGNGPQVRGRFTGPVRKWHRYLRRGDVVLAGRPGPVRRLLRRRSVWWTMVAVLAVSTAAMLQSAWADAERARLAWGATTPVLVATGDIEPGSAILDRVESRTWPTAMVPAGSLRTADGHVVAVSLIGRGEVIAEHRVADVAVSGLAGRLPTGTSAVSIPLGVGVPALVPGDRVAIVATFNQIVDVAGPDGLPTRTVQIVDRALVIAVGEHDATLAVDADSVAAVADALAQAATTVVLTN